MSELVLFLDRKQVAIYKDGGYLNLTASDNLLFDDENIDQFVDDLQLVSGFTGNRVRIFYEGEHIVHEGLQAPFSQNKKDIRAFVKRKMENGLAERLPFDKFQYGFQYFDNEKSGSSVSIDMVNQAFVAALSKSFRRKNIRISFFGSFGSLIYELQDKDKEIAAVPRIIMLYQSMDSSASFMYTGGHKAPYFIRYANTYTSIEAAYQECFSRSVHFARQRFANPPESIVCIGDATHGFQELHGSDETIYIDMGRLLSYGLTIADTDSDLLSSDEKISGMQRRAASFLLSLVFLLFVSAIVIEAFSFVNQTSHIDNLDRYMKVENDKFLSLSRERKEIVSEFERTKLISHSQNMDAYYILYIIANKMPSNMELTRYDAVSVNENRTDIVINGIVFENTSKAYETISNMIESLKKVQGVRFQISDSWSRKWIELTYKIKHPKRTGIPFVIKGQVYINAK